jgi:hypothetical protein
MKGAKEKPCPVWYTEQGSGTNLHHKILCSCGYCNMPAGERQEV